MLARCGRNLFSSLARLTRCVAANEDMAGVRGGDMEEEDEVGGEEDIGRGEGAG
jgi:hypothetical protein